jgi:hypothetical protein
MKWRNGGSVSMWQHQSMYQWRIDGIEKAVNNGQLNQYQAENGVINNEISR